LERPDIIDIEKPAGEKRDEISDHDENQRDGQKKLSPNVLLVFQMKAGIDVSEPKITAKANRDDGEKAEEQRKPAILGQNAIFEKIRKNIEDEHPEVGIDHVPKFADLLLGTDIAVHSEKNRRPIKEAIAFSDHISQMRSIHGGRFLRKHRTSSSPKRITKYPRKTILR
jgi:hypothetical protein